MHKVFKWKCKQKLFKNTFFIKFQKLDFVQYDFLCFMAHSSDDFSFSFGYVSQFDKNPQQMT